MAFWGRSEDIKGSRRMHSHIHTDPAGKKLIPSPASLTLFHSSSVFFLLSAAQRLHTSGTGALIDLWEQSKIEAETGDGGSFCTLSGDPRERKKEKRGSGVYKIKRWGRERAHLSWRGSGGGKSFTQPEGRSQSLTSDPALKEGNLGEGGGRRV